jgi:hypothetical protein
MIILTSDWSEHLFYQTPSHSTLSTNHPLIQPSSHPTTLSSNHPFIQPSSHPTTLSSNHPFIQPSSHPITFSSNHPLIQPLLVSSNSCPTSCRICLRRDRRQTPSPPWHVITRDHMWSPPHTCTTSIASRAETWSWWKHMFTTSAVRLPPNQTWRKNDEVWNQSLSR